MLEVTEVVTIKACGNEIHLTPLGNTVSTVAIRVISQRIRIALLMARHVGVVEKYE